MLSRGMGTLIRRSCICTLICMQDSAAKQEAIHCLKECITEISYWMTMNSLKLNEEKTEFLTIMSKHYQMKAMNTVLPLAIGDCSIMPSTSVNNFGAVFG